MVDSFYISISFISFVFGLMGVVLSTWCVIELKSMMKSTHKIEYMPIDTNWTKSENELNKKINLDVDDMMESII